jgi:Domain of unknown function (DUF1854)
MSQRESDNGAPARIDFRLHHDPLGQLVFVSAAGQEHIGVAPVRGFPVSEPDYGISIVDDNGAELIWIRHLGDLPAHMRELIEQELDQREFMPQLRRIVSISANSEPCEWEVETDRGRTKFLLKTDEDVRRIDDRRAMVTDTSGISYLIEDVTALDAKSRRYLERYL